MDVPPADGEHLVAGRYRLVEPIGRGGMGVVWRATDTLLHRDVAVKEVRVAGIDDPHERDQAFRRTLREARLAAGLHHPGIVTIHDVVTDDDRPWIVMERIDAPSLEAVLDDDGPLPPDRAARVTLNVLDALGAAHAVGVLHRDVKPGNILVLPGDRVVLTDFGIATNPADTGLTRSGAIVGSPEYLAPERIGEHPATAASDIWSLGATLFAMTEGYGPFKRDSVMATLGAIATTTAPEARHAGPLRPTIAAMLARDPDDRMTPDAVTDALTAALGRPSADGVATVRDAPSTLVEVVPGAERKRRPWAAAGAAAALVVLLGGGVWYALSHPGTGSPTAGRTTAPGQAPTPPPGIADWLSTPTPAPSPTNADDRYDDPAGRFTIDFSSACPRDDPEVLIPPSCLASPYQLEVTVDKVKPTSPAALIRGYYRTKDASDTYLRYGPGKFLGFDAASREFTYEQGGETMHEFELIAFTSKHRYDLTVWASDFAWGLNKGDINAVIGSFRPT
jgi:serine/threonine protein kinase